MSSVNIDAEFIEKLDYLSALEFLEENVKDCDPNSFPNEKAVKDYLLLRYARTPCTHSPMDAFLEISDDFDKKITNMLCILRRMFAFLDKSNVRSDLTQRLDAEFPGWKSRLEQIKYELENQKIPILVAGETGAGKTSLINVLLGETVLPEDTFSCTSMLCSIENNPCKRLIFCNIDERGSQSKREVKKIDLTTMTEDVRKSIDSVLTNRSDNQKYNHCILQWPLPFLGNKITIVDSPGIGERSRIDQIVLNYLSNAMAFIFVINGYNAGGVQARVESLLREARKVASGFRNLSSDSSGWFDHRCALFVFTHWDETLHHTTEEELTHVKQTSLEKIVSAWPSLDVDKQVFYLSARQLFSMARQNAGYPEEFHRFMTNLRNMIPISLELRITSHYLFLNKITKSCIERVRIRLNTVRILPENRLKRYKEVNDEYSAFKNKISKTLRELKSTINSITSGVCQLLCDHLKNVDTVSRMRELRSSPLPVTNDMEVLTILTTQCFSKRLESEIIRWNSDNSALDDAMRNVNQLIHTAFTQMDGDVQRINSQLALDDDVITFGDANVYSKLESHHVFDTFEKVIIGATSVVWLPLAVVAGLFVTPVFLMLNIRDSIKTLSAIKRYNENKTQVIEEWFDEYIKKLNPEKVKNGFLSGFLNKIYTTLEEMESYIPQLLEAKKQEVIDIENETRSTTAIIRFYDPMLCDLKKISGEISLFHTRYGNRKDHCSIGDFVEESHWKKLSSGGFGAIYEVKRNNSDEAVAIKTLHKDINEDNAYSYFGEERILRELTALGPHPNIVAWLGALYAPAQGSDPEFFGIVMELCAMSLKECIHKNSKFNICRQKNRSDIRCAFDFVIDTALQIAKGLQFLHKHGIVHRDLKIENVLVSEQSDGRLRMKLCDVGLSKHKEEITRTLAGTLFYIAPEVLNFHGASPSSDVYSLGLVMWEVYFCKRVFGDNFTLSAAQEGGLKLEFSLPIPSQLKVLIIECSSFQILDRPIIGNCVAKLQEFASHGKFELFWSSDLYKLAATQI